MKPGGLGLSELNIRHIVVDGDACPVKTEIAQTARLFNIPVLLVSSYDHLLQGGEGVRTVQVDRSDQSADLYIANHIKPYDVVITQDYGLAALALGKRCYVLSFRGRSSTIVTLISCWILVILRPKHEKEAITGKAQSLSQSRIEKCFNIN